MPVAGGTSGLCNGSSPSAGEWASVELIAAGELSSNASADPIRTVLSRSLTLRSYDGIIPLSTAPRARGPREISTCS